MGAFEALGGLAVFLLGVLWLLLIVLWVMLPFAVFGIKNRLDKMMLELRGIHKSLDGVPKEQQKTNEALAEQVDMLKALVVLLRSERVVSAAPDSGEAETVHFACGECGTRMEAEVQYKGQMGECPQCHAEVEIP